MEIIKHLFNLENITFVLAIDMEHLSHSIATIYGQNMDSTGYLRRFFDLNFKMPLPSTDEYINYLITDKLTIS
nr:P-loop NTPase fold protein [Clostridium acidisoli]